jgi:hypothetical protein
MVFAAAAIAGFVAVVVVAAAAAAVAGAFSFSKERKLPTNPLVLLGCTRPPG